MASNISQPRTVFHRRLQATNDSLERGFSDLKSSLDKLTTAVTVSPFKSILNQKIKDLVNTECPWKLHVIKCGATIRDSIFAICRCGITTLLVVDDEYKVIGILPPAQIFEAYCNEKLYDKVGNFAQPIISIKENETVEKAFEEFKNPGVKRLLIVDAKGNPKALLTSGMLLRWLIETIMEL